MNGKLDKKILSTNQKKIELTKIIDCLPVGCVNRFLKKGDKAVVCSNCIIAFKAQTTEARGKSERERERERTSMLASIRVNIKASMLNT